jgi:hypothetical protein
MESGSEDARKVTSYNIYGSLNPEASPTISLVREASSKILKLI